MVHSQESFIIANFVSKLRSSSPLSCDCLPQEAEFCESDADVTLYERYIETGRCQKIIQCSLDALSVIREVSTGYADLHWNPGLKPGDVATFKIIYPVLRSSLDCLLNQTAPKKSEAKFKPKEPKEKYNDSSTLTFEGLFLLIKNSLELIHPLAYSCDGVVLSQLISLLERTSYSVHLANANLSSLTVYLCRLYSFGYLIRVPDNDDLILRQHSVLFYRVVCLALASPGKTVDPNALLFLKRVVGTVLFVMNENVNEKAENIDANLVMFMSKFVDVWYASLVKLMVSIRTDTLPALLSSRQEPTAKKREPEASQETNEDQASGSESEGEKSEKSQSAKINSSEKTTSGGSADKGSDTGSEKGLPRTAAEEGPKKEKLITSDKEQLLMKLCKLTYETPKLPPSHRMRLITQITFILLEANSNELELEALNAILALLDFSDESNSAILKNNLLPLLKALTGVLMNRVEASGIGLVNIVEEVQIEKYVLLVYCLGQVLLNVVLFKHEYDEENVDKFLQEQIKLIDPRRENNDRALQSWDLELFEMTSNIMKIFHHLLSVNDDKVDEAVTHVICWMLTETNFEYTFKLAVPICCFMLRTKNSRMLDAIYGKSGTRVTTTQIAISTSKRWLSGSKIFKTSLEYYLNTRTNNESSDERGSKVGGESEDMDRRGDGKHMNGGSSGDAAHSYGSSPSYHVHLDTNTGVANQLHTSTSSTGYHLNTSTSSSTKRDLSAERTGEDEVDVYLETDTVVKSLFLNMFESYLEVMVETSGNVEEEMEECLGIYFACFGMEDYLKRMPLEKLYKVPITNERYRVESYSFMLPVLKRQMKGLKMREFAKHILPVLNSLDYFVNKTAQIRCKAGSIKETAGEAEEGVKRTPSEKWAKRLRYISKLESVHKEYEGVYNQLLQLCVPLSSDPDAIEVLVEDNYALLKYIVTLLDKGAERFNTACKVIENLEGLNRVGLELIGILVKKYINIEINMERTPDNGNMCENILAAIGNVSRFCASEVLSKNLQSFEKALNGKRNDALVRLSKALFPYVSDDLKQTMYRNYLSQPKEKYVYVALKVALETVMEKLEKNKDLLRAINNASLDPYRVKQKNGSLERAEGMEAGARNGQLSSLEITPDLLNALSGSKPWSAGQGGQGSISLPDTLSMANVTGMMGGASGLPGPGVTPSLGATPLRGSLRAPGTIGVATAAMEHAEDMGAVDKMNAQNLTALRASTASGGTSDARRYGEEATQNAKDPGLRKSPRLSGKMTPSMGIRDSDDDGNDNNDGDRAPEMDLDDANPGSEKLMRVKKMSTSGSEDVKRRSGQSLLSDESTLRGRRRELSRDGKERRGSDGDVRGHSSEEFEDSEEHENDDGAVTKNWEEDEEYKFVKMVVRVNGMCELATYLEILSESVDTAKQRISCLVAFTKLLLYLKENLDNVDYGTLIALITKPLIFECVVNCCTNNKVNRASSFLIYHMLYKLNGNYHHVLKVTLSTLYYNHAINKEGENVNIGIMKLLCNIFGACYKEFDNIETLRLVVYLSGRLTQCSYRFYVHLLKFFRVVMVHMNNDHLIQAAQHMMKLLYNERYANKAKTYELQQEYPHPYNGFEQLPIVDQSVPNNKEHLLVRRRAAAAHKLRKKALEEKERERDKAYRYIKISKKGSKKETVKVLKSIIKNKHK
nr:hypothetical protein MACL_00000519 [Theileria orientalis]